MGIEYPSVRQVPGFFYSKRGIAAMRTRTMIKYPTLFGFILLCLVSISAGSCGLPKILYLYPPLSFYASGSSTVILVHDTKNYDALEGANQSFKGYEIFYRIYDTESKAISDISLINNKIDIAPDSPDIIMRYAADTLKFLRMKNSSTSSQPLITIGNPENSGQFDLTLNQDSEWTISGETLGISIDVVRTITDSTRLSFSQKSNYLSSDSDYSGTTDSPDSLYAVFFAVAYAHDPETIGQIVYSIPVVLSVPIQF